MWYRSLSRLAFQSEFRGLCIQKTFQRSLTAPRLSGSGRFRGWHRWAGSASRWSIKMLPHSANKRVVFEYACLSFGVLGLSYFTFREYRHGTHGKEEGLKVLLLAAFTTGLGYLGHRYIHQRLDFRWLSQDGVLNQRNLSLPVPVILESRVAHCQTDAESAKNPVDGALRETQKKLKMAQDDAREKFFEMREDASEIISMKTEELWTRLRDKYVTKAMEEAFDFVTNIIKNLRDFGGIDDEEFDSPLFVLLALIKTAQDEFDQAWINSLPKTSSVDSITFDLHRRVSSHALQVYDASGEEDPKKQAQIMKIPSEKDIVYTYFKDTGDHVPKFILFLDHEIGSLVLSIRGTHSLTDVIIDVICDDEEFLDGHAHRGIMRGSCKVLKQIQTVLRQTLEEHPRYRLILTGHSLGAGTAELLTMVILKNKAEYIPEDTEVQCIAIAPPPVYRTDHEVPKEMADAIRIYINNQDCVPRMCLGSIAKLLAMVRAVDKLEMEKTDQFKVLVRYDDDETANNLKRIQDEIMRIKQDRFPFLEHPGKINYLYKLKPSGQGEQKLSEKMLVVTQESASFTRELFLLERMILDHLKPYYIQAFDNCYIGKPSK